MAGPMAWSGMHRPPNSGPSDALIRPISTHARGQVTPLRSLAMKACRGDKMAESLAELQPRAAKSSEPSPGHGGRLEHQGDGRHRLRVPARADGALILVLDRRNPFLELANGP